MNVVFKCPPGCEDRTWFLPPPGADVSVWAWYRIHVLPSVRYTQSWVYWNQDALNFVAETSWDDAMRYECVCRGVRILDFPNFSVTCPPALSSELSHCIGELQEADEHVRRVYFANKGRHPQSGFLNPTADESFETPAQWADMDASMRSEWICDQVLSTNMLGHSTDDVRSWALANVDQLMAADLPTEAVVFLRSISPKSFENFATIKNRRPPQLRANWRLARKPSSPDRPLVCLNNTGIPEFSLPWDYDVERAASWAYFALLTLGSSFGNDHLYGWVSDNYDWLQEVAEDFWDDEVTDNLAISIAGRLCPLVGLIRGRAHNPKPIMAWMGRLNDAYVFRNRNAMHESHRKHL